MIDLDKINIAKHIVLLCDKESFANANALYSFILTKHKKVTLVSEDNIPKKYSFLPWFKELKDNIPTSSDCVIKINSDVLCLFEFFKSNGFKINVKIATSLYAALLIKYNFFTGVCDGMVFAIAKELIELKADCKTCIEYLKSTQSLSFFRLKGILYSNLLLVENATVALLFFDKIDLQSSGADIDDVNLIMKEVLDIVHVKEVRLVKNNKIIKSIKGNLV